LEPSLTDRATHATPLASAHPLLVSRGPDAPIAPLEPLTHVPHATSASTPGALARPVWPHQPSVIAPPHGQSSPTPTPGPQDPPVRPDRAFGKVYERHRRRATPSVASTSSLAAAVFFIRSCCPLRPATLADSTDCSGCSC
jgi:hypothetical protein